MENSTLHSQKVAILSRLIKESSLTLEEAILLLKEEESLGIKPLLPINIPGTAAPNHPWNTPTTAPWQPRDSGILYSNNVQALSSLTAQGSDHPTPSLYTNN